MTPDPERTLAATQAIADIAHVSLEVAGTALKAALAALEGQTQPKAEAPATPDRLIVAGDGGKGVDKAQGG